METQHVHDAHRRQRGGEQVGTLVDDRTDQQAAEQRAERAQEARRRVQPDRRLQIRPVERLAQHAPEFPVHADIDVGIDQAALPELAAHTLEDWFVHLNPRKVNSAEELLPVLQAAW
mgnify:CR=1 FL=1